MSSWRGVTSGSQGVPGPQPLCDSGRTPAPLIHMNQCGDIGFLLGLRVTDMSCTSTHLAFWKWHSLRMGSGYWAVSMPWPLYRRAAIPSFPCARPADRGWSWRDRTQRVGALFVPDFEAIPLALQCMQREGPGCCFLLFGVGARADERETNPQKSGSWMDFFNAPLRETNSAKLH